MEIDGGFASWLRGVTMIWKMCKTWMWSVLGLLLLGVSSASSELTQDLDAIMSDFVDQQEISGAVTLAIHEGEVIHFSAVGMASIEEARPMTKETLFRIASLTKNYSAVLVKILEEEGKLSVNDRVDKYLPEFRSMGLKLDDGKGPVDLRIWHLMSHTSGVDIPKDYYGTPDLEASAKLISKEKLNFRPGTQWKYGKGMDVCGRIVEVVSGKSFDQYLAEKITIPLGLKDTAYFVDEEEAQRLAVVYMPDKKNGGIIPGDHISYRSAPKEGVKPNPSSGLISSTNEVGIYYSMLLNGGVYEGTRILSEKSVQDLVRNWTGEMETNPVSGTAWGLGFGHIREPQGVTAMLSPGTYGHGGAYGTQAWVDPATKTIYVLMIQRKGFGNGDMSEIRKAFQQVVADYVKRDLPVTWHEGPKKPAKPEMMGEAKFHPEGGLMMIGTKGMIYHEGMRPKSPRLYPESLWQDYRSKPEMRTEKVYPRIKGSQMDEWMRAIKGEGPKPGSSFDYAGPLTEAIVLGSLAIRTGKPIDYDPEKMVITNNPEANALLHVEAREGFRVEDIT